MVQGTTEPQFEITKEGFFRLTESFVYYLPWDRDQFVIVPVGYRTNFASVPWFARWLVSPIDPHIRIPALVHDWLVFEFGIPQDIEDRTPFLFKVTAGVVRRRVLSWRDSAWILKTMMKHTDAPRWKRFVVYAGVRIYGWATGRK